MRFLRTASTRRLFATFGGALAVIVAGAAIALAAQGSGPIPPRTTLAKALHRALAAPKVSGITARISFTDHLISSSDINGSDPILTGASGRMWLSSGNRIRLELQSDNGDAQLVLNGRSFWVSMPSAHTVYEGTLPAGKQDRSRRPHAERIPTVATIQATLHRVMAHVLLSGAMPGDIAGKAAYTVAISPRHDGGLLGAAQLAWDAARGVPLRLAVYARGSSTPVLELKAKDISYGPVDASVFSIAPPSGDKVVKVAMPAASAKARRSEKATKHHHEVSGVAAVSRHLSFKLLARKRLAGLPRRSVSLIDLGGKPGALVTYGQNLGGIVVLESTEGTGAGKSSAAGGSHDGSGLSLPTVSINGATGQELDTALGTLIRFSRAGVSYTVLGSVPPAAAESAARGL